jgi:hypothetical protein
LLLQEAWTSVTSLPFGLDRDRGGRLSECLGRNAGLRLCRVTPLVSAR